MNNVSPFSPITFKSTCYNDQAESERRKRLIELAFSSDSTGYEDQVIGDLEVPEIPQTQVETLAHMAQSDFEKFEVVTSATTDADNILGEAYKIMVQRENTEDTTVFEHENIDELDKGTSILCSGKDMTPWDQQKSIFDEIAKRCLKSPSDIIDRKLLEEMEQLGILQSVVKDTSNVPKVEDETVQIVCPRRARKLRKKTEDELKTQIFDKATVNIPKRNIINRRAMRHIALRLGTFAVSDLTTDIIMNQEQNKAPMKATEVHELNTVKNEVSSDHFCEREHETPYDFDAFNSLTGITIDETIDESDFESKSPATTLSEECVKALDHHSVFENCKQAGQSELDIGLEEIKRIFDDGEIPRHTFMSLKPPTKQERQTSSHFMASTLLNNTNKYNDIYDSINDYSSILSCSNLENSPTGSAEDTNSSAEAVPSERVYTSSEPLNSELRSNEATIKADCVDEIVQTSVESDCGHSNAQSHAVLSTMMNKQEKETNQQSFQSIITTQKPNLFYKDEKISLSEMLRRVRQRARLESFEQIVFTSQVTEANESVVQKQAPCAPLATPPNPKVVPPRPCPGKRPKPKESNPCGPPKKNTCEKFRRISLVDSLGVVVTRVPEVGVLQNWPNKALDKKPLPQSSTVMFVPEVKGFVRGVNIKCPEKIALNFVPLNESCDPYNE